MRVVNIILPLIRHDLLPMDPFLRTIELKKRYYSYNSLKESPLQDNTVTALHLTDFHYFVGTLKGGVFRYSRGINDSKVIQVPGETLYNRAVTDIRGDAAELVIASYASLMKHTSASDKIELLISGGGDRSVLALSQLGDHYYFGTTGGSFYQYDGQGIEELVHFDSPVKSIKNGHNKLMIFTAKGNLYLYDLLTGRYEEFDFTGLEIEDLSVNDMEIWGNSYFLSTSEGLIIYDHRKEEFSRLYHDAVLLCSASSERYIYWGTHSTGLIIYDKIKKTYSQWGLEMGLPSLNITAIEADGEEVILGFPDKGLLIINEEIHEKI